MRRSWPSGRIAGIAVGVHAIVSTFVACVAPKHRFAPTHRGELSCIQAAPARIDGEPQ